MILTVKELIWDEFNSSHIAKHAVTLEEVGQICSGKVKAWPSHHNRFLVVRYTKKRRLLTVILAQKAKGIFYPVSARDASRKERGWMKHDSN